MRPPAVLEQTSSGLLARFLAIFVRLLVVLALPGMLGLLGVTTGLKFRPARTVCSQPTRVLIIQVDLSPLVTLTLERTGCLLHPLRYPFALGIHVLSSRPMLPLRSWRLGGTSRCMVLLEDSTPCAYRKRMAQVLTQNVCSAMTVVGIRSFTTR